MLRDKKINAAAALQKILIPKVLITFCYGRR